MSFTEDTVSKSDNEDAAELSKPAPYDDTLSEVAGPSAKKSPDHRKFTDFDGSAITLAEIVKKETYVDKSLFLKAIFNPRSWDCHLITAPRRFGKSTILDMVKCFVEIEVDENEKIKVKGTRNRNLFNEKLHDGSSLKIMNENEIVNAHFGQYPVIHVDFKCDGVIDSFDTATRWCKRVVQAAYTAHEYLINSPLLEEREVKICKKWINDVDKIESLDITYGLNDLAIFLFKHYKGKSVFVLVDEYDSVIMNALFEVDEKTLCNIAQLCIGILSAVLKTSHEEYSIGGPGKSVARGIITGIPHIALSIFGLDNVRSVPFLRQTQFLDYYGLTDSEIDELLSRLESKGNKISRNDLEAYYNGYVSENGSTIYPLWSVLKCLDNQETGQYYDGTGTMEKLSNAFQTPEIRSKVQRLLLGLNVPIIFNEDFGTNDLEELHNQFSEPGKRKYLEADVFFSFLFEQGYLTYGPEKCPENFGFEKVNVRVANEEIKEIFKQKLAEHYTDFCKFDESKRDVCRESFETLIKFANSDDVNFKTGVELLRKDLEDLLRDALSNETCLRLEEALYASVGFVFFQSDFQYTIEHRFPTNKPLDLVVVKDDCGIVLEFRYHNDESSETTAACALQQAKTYPHSQLFKTKNIFKTRPKKIILMGLGINKDKDLSFAYVINGKKMETVYVPDKEKTGISRKSSSKRKGNTKIGHRAKSTKGN